MKKLFEILASFSDTKWLFIDGIINSGACSNNDEAVSKSVAGNTTKIHLAVDSCDFELSGGHIHDVNHGKSLVLRSLKAEVITADKGYDSNDFRNQIEELDSRANVPRKGNSKVGN